MFQLVQVNLKVLLDQGILENLFLLLCLGFHSVLENLRFQLVRYRHADQPDQPDQQGQLGLLDLAVQAVLLPLVDRDFLASLESPMAQMVRLAQLVLAVPGHLCCQQGQRHQRHLWHPVSQASLPIQDSRLVHLVPLLLEAQAVLCFLVFQVIPLFQHLLLDPVLLVTLECLGCHLVPYPLLVLCHQMDP